MPEKRFFPFLVLEDEENFRIMAPIEDAELIKKYDPLFSKYKYEPNGYCWEGHIEQILEKIDPELLSRLDFDSEGGCFNVYAQSQNDQIKFVELLSPIFSDLKLLEEYIKNADRNRVDD
jgi:hypothetical protein